MFNEGGLLISVKLNTYIFFRNTILEPNSPNSWIPDNLCQSSFEIWDIYSLQIKTRGQFMYNKMDFIYEALRFQIFSPEKSACCCWSLFWIKLFRLSYGGKQIFTFLSIKIL